MVEAPVLLSDREIKLPSNKLKVGDSVEVIYKGSKDTGRVGILVPRPRGRGRGYQVDYLDGTGSGWTFATSLKKIAPIEPDEYEAAVRILGEDYFA